MSRSYASFLLFEDVLTNLPAGSDLIIKAANTLMNPYVQVIDTNCGTLLGSIEILGYNLEGAVELANDTPLTVSRISTLLGQGVTTIRIRNISTCVSKAGICSTCYQASFGGPIVPVGTTLILNSEFVYMTQVIQGDGINTIFPVLQNSSEYDYTNVADYPGAVLTDTTITFPTVLSTSDRFALKFYKTSSDPFLEYIAKSYSGSILGISPLPSYQLLLKPSLYETMFSSSHIDLLRNELNSYSKNIPPSYLTYCDTIIDTLEKVLYIIYIYAIYANVS